MDKKIEKEERYQVEMTKRQVQLLSYACDQFSRLICGQDFAFQDLMESAWEKRCEEATGNGFDKKWDGGWSDMRKRAEVLCKEIKRMFWGLERNSLFGVGYDKTSDILYDIHQVFRHQLWLDSPEEDKSRWTVDASDATKFGDEPLVTIKKVEDGQDS